jgi:hypothetical protein
VTDWARVQYRVQLPAARDRVIVRISGFGFVSVRNFFYTWTTDSYGSEYPGCIVGLWMPSTFCGCGLFGWFVFARLFLHLTLGREIEGNEKAAV